MKNTILIFAFATCITSSSCKKNTTTPSTDPRVPPKMELKTGGSYVFADKTVNKLDTVLLGIILTRTEDNLTSFNGSVSYDGASTTTSFFNHQCTSAEYPGYSFDINYYVRNQTGTEKLTLAIVDRDGNITKKTIVLTVQ